MIEKQSGGPDELNNTIQDYNPGTQKYEAEQGPKPTATKEVVSEKRKAGRAYGAGIVLGEIPRKPLDPNFRLPPRAVLEKVEQYHRAIGEIHRKIDKAEGQVMHLDAVVAEKGRVIPGKGVMVDESLELAKFSKKLKKIEKTERENAARTNNPELDKIKKSSDYQGFESCEDIEKLRHLERNERRALLTTELIKNNPLLKEFLNPSISSGKQDRTSASNTNILGKRKRDPSSNDGPKIKKQRTSR